MGIVHEDSIMSMVNTRKKMATAKRKKALNKAWSYCADGEVHESEGELPKWQVC